MNAPGVTPRFLRRERRRIVGHWLGWSVAATLGALALGRWSDLHGFPYALTLQLLTLGLAASLLAQWVRTSRRLTTVAVAREVDRRHGLEALVESAHELREAGHPLAAQVRAAADDRLRDKRVAGTRRWLTAWAVAVLAAGSYAWAVLAPTAATGGAREAAQGTHPEEPAAAGTSSPPEAEPPAWVEIAWQAPARQHRARGYEEVPLRLQVESNRALRGAELRISLNGRTGYARPLELAGLDVSPGASGVVWPLPLFLDETGAQPYDTVFYSAHVTAGQGPGAVVARSSHQMVEIAPLADLPPLPTDARGLLETLEALNRAQADLLARTLDLHAAGKSAPEALAELFAAQARVTIQAETAAAMAVHLADASAAVRAVSTLAAQGEAARTALAGGRPADAVPAQAQMLTIIAAAARALTTASAVADAEAEATPDPETAGSNAADASAARALEELTRRQGVVNGRIQAAAAEPDTLMGIGTEQAGIAHGLEHLVASGALIPPVKTLVQRAQAAAAEAARHLALHDLQATREPAAEAERLLRQALDLHETEARKAANAVLEEARLALQQAAALTDPAAQDAELQRLARALEKEIERQRRQGSAEAARQIQRLSQQIKQAQAEAARQGRDEQKDGEQEAEEQEAEEQKPTDRFVAELRAWNSPADSAPVGTARLRMEQLGDANLAVAFDHRPAGISDQRIVVVTSDGAVKVVAQLPRGAFSGRRVGWITKEVEPAGIELALHEERLALEVVAAGAPNAGWRGIFVPEGNPGGGPPRGLSGLGRRGPRSTQPQTSLAMPTVGPDEVTLGQALLQVSTAAAESQAALAPDQTLSQTIRQLKAAAALSSAATQDASTLARLRLAVEKAQVLAALGGEATGAPGGASSTRPRSTMADAGAVQALLEQAAQLATELERSATKAEREKELRRFVPEQIDPAYRRPVQEYFLILSRETERR